jgi:hypothetical protein
VRDKARAEIDALRAACRCLEWERNTARAKVAEQGAELGRVRAQLEDLAERAIPCIELAQEIPDDDEDAAEILHTLEVATGTLQALAIEALSAPEPKKEG